jgi:hypothetical protein
MDKPEFRLSDHDVESRLRGLPPKQAQALEQALEGMGKAGEGAEMAWFLLPLAEAGLDGALMARIAAKVPGGWPLDHREMFWDFRLDRWIRHLEPPTLPELLDELVRNAETPEQGMAYIRREWEAFLGRQSRKP